MKTFTTHHIINGIMYSGENIIAEDWDEANRIAHQKGLEVIGILEEVIFDGGWRGYDNDFKPGQSRWGLF